MLRRILLLVLVIVLVAGCVPKRQVLDGNIFQSAIPTLSIKVNPQLAYAGMTETGKFSFGSEHSILDVAQTRHEVYYFLDASPEKRLKRFFIVHASHLVDKNWRYADAFEKG